MNKTNKANNKDNRFIKVTTVDNQKMLLRIDRIISVCDSDILYDIDSDAPECIHTNMSPMELYALIVYNKCFR